MAKRPTLDAVTQAADDALRVLAGHTVDNPLAKMMIPFVQRAKVSQQIYPTTTTQLAVRLFKESANVIV